ncbi:cytosol nonspecific dipeptidase, partial [Escherichia coli]|nr:cytosol nonspecific dipeptidase [Escherichia coli]
AVPAENQEKLAELFNYYTELLKAELGKVETGIVTFNEEIATESQAFTAADQQRFIAALNACPNGVMRMSDEIEGVVETSLNVGVITTEENKVTVLCLIRSLI